MMIFSQTQSTDIQLALFPPAASQSLDSSPKLTTPLPAEMLQVFEEITGWVIGFEESKASFQSRQFSSNSAREGTFSIVDMSAQWPARKPTSHRAKCDQLVAHLDELVNELQATKAKLAKTQSLLEAHAPGTVADDEAELFDCFVPRYVEEEWDRAWDEDEDFELKDDLINDASSRVVDPPFEGWRMGGSPGVIHGNFVDWKVTDDEQIELHIGETSLQASNVDRESTLTVDPLTHEYALSGDEDFEFYLYDQTIGELSVIEKSTAYRRLPSKVVVLGTTSNELKEMVGPEQNLILTGQFEDLAQQLSNLLGKDEPFLLLQRG